MKAESIVYAIAGMCFGIILGWIIATEQPGRTQASAPAQETAAQTQAPPSGGGQQAKALDEARVQQLTTILNSDPKNAGAMVQLGNTKSRRAAAAVFRSVLSTTICRLRSSGNASA